MISAKSRNGAIALGALLLVSLWVAQRQREEGVGPIEGLDTRLDYAISDLVFRYFDAEGQPAITMRSPRFTSDTASGTGHINQPRLVVHHAGYRWDIAADSATVSSDRERVHLAGDVRLDRQAGAEPSAPLTLVGSEVTIEVTPRIASSTRPVQLTEPSGHLDAVGFSVDMTNNHYHLLENVRAIYVTN